MNWDEAEKINDDELEEDLEEDEECQLIDPNDLIIIDDSQNWHPTTQYIVSYAKQLGFDPNKDPKELITVAEKYLTYRLPDNIKRAFTKKDYQILYIDMTTQEIQLRTQIEEQATEEFERIRFQYNKKMKKTDEGKNFLNDLKQKTDDELKRKLEEQKKFMEKDKFRDDKILNLNLDSEEDKQDNSNDEIHLEDNANELNNKANGKEEEEEDDDDKKRNKNKTYINNMKNNKNNNNNTRYKEIGVDDCFDVDDKSSVNDSINDNKNKNLKKSKNNQKELDLKLNDEEIENVEKYSNIKNSLKSSQEKKESKINSILYSQINQ